MTNTPQTPMAPLGVQSLEDEFAPAPQAWSAPVAAVAPEPAELPAPTPVEEPEPVSPSEVKGSEWDIPYEPPTPPQAPTPPQPEYTLASKPVEPPPLSPIMPAAPQSREGQVDNGGSEAPEIGGTEVAEGNRLFRQVLQVLHSANDLGLDAVARNHVEAALRSNRLPQLACRDLLSQKVINRLQLARAVARANKCREIMSFLDIPPEALMLRQTLEPRILTLLRKERIIPISVKVTDDQPSKEVHLAHENSARDLVLEAQLADYFPAGTKIQWHFGLREVAGAYWLAGESENIDTGMEAEALLDRIIGNAVDARSSDIHIDPSIKGEPRAIIKYRVDGFVHPKEVITTEQLDRLKVRIENLARMAKVNMNHANKGAFTRAGYDWRVQIQPHAGRLGTVPRIVMRRLQPEVMPLEALGYPAYFIEKIKQAASAPNGVIFWTGPTGSGKTESIHAAVVSVSPMAKGLSVHTIEDPPEKRVPGYAIQMEIMDEDPMRTGLQLLKSSLRADPDVVIFGEVRDGEMAKLVFDAANTGHMVFTTLHTNTALDAIMRLDELGIKGFLLSYVRGIASQRLLRRLCHHCKIKTDKPDEYTMYVFDRYGVPLRDANLHIASAEGCINCNFTGYYGRVAAAEWLKPTKEIVDASIRGQFEQIEDMARRAGWQPMGHMGTLHVKNGITDAAELSNKILELSTEVLHG